MRIDESNKHLGKRATASRSMTAEVTARVAAAQVSTAALGNSLFGKRNVGEAAKLQVAQACVCSAAGGPTV